MFGKTLGKEKNFRSLVAFGKAALLFQYKPIQKYLLTAYSIDVKRRRISYRRAKKIWPVPTESNTEDIGYYDYRPVTLLFACFISFQRYALS